MALGDDDNSVFFSDFAVPVVFGTQTAKGLVDAYDNRDSLGAGEVDIADRITDVTVPSAAFSPFPKRGDALTVNAASMKVRDLVQEKDGALTHLLVVKP